MAKWTVERNKEDTYKWFKDMKKNVIYYYYNQDSNIKGYVQFICPVCQKHSVHLPFEHRKPKERWWSAENTWQFDVNDDGTFVMNPSVQMHGECKGHFWFKQQEPRIY